MLSLKFAYLTKLNEAIQVYYNYLTLQKDKYGPAHRNRPFPLIFKDALNLC